MLKLIQVAYPRTHVLESNNMYPELALDVIMPPYAQGTVLYQEIFFPGCTVFKYADGGIKPPKFDHAQLS